MESAFELRPIDTQPFSQAMSLPSGASNHSNAKPQRLERLRIDPPMNTDRTPGPGRRCRVPHAAMSKSDAAAPFARAGRCISLATTQSTVSGPNQTTRCGVRLPGSVLKKPHSARYGVENAVRFGNCPVAGKRFNTQQDRFVLNSHFPPDIMR